MVSAVLSLTGGKDWA